MDLVHILITLVIVGLILWLVERYIPMGEPVKTIFHIFVAIVAILWLLNILGIFHSPGLTVR
jgi:hypothetical protein